MVALAKPVTIEGTRYAAGTDHTQMPAAVVDRIRNGEAWVGGTAPALSAPPVGRADITPADLSTAAKAREVLGLARRGDGLTVPAVTKSGDHTLTVLDTGVAIEFTGSSPATLTVPANSTTAIPVGTVVEVVQYGTGQVTVAAAGGVTLRTPASLTTRARYSAVSLRKRAADEWVVGGDLT